MRTQVVEPERCQTIALDNVATVLRNETRRIAHTQYQAMWLEWPTLREATLRLAHMTGGKLLPAYPESTPLLTHCLSVGAAIINDTGYATEEARARFVRTMIDELLVVLDYTAAFEINGRWRAWEPLEESVSALVSRLQPTGFKVIKEPHPLQGASEARAIVASRVFNLRELEAAGLVGGAHRLPASALSSEQ